jgi:ubiquinone/menaquinone biosynthesis C-methylase UbiE
MTAHHWLRLASALAILEGVALAVGGHRTLRITERLVPGWFTLWLRPLERAPQTVVRGLGLAEGLFGVWLLAMAPPTPRGVRAVADAVHDPGGTLARLTVARAAERAWRARVREAVVPGARVLDLGCGDGSNLAWLLASGLPIGSYLGLDPSPTALARARARFADCPQVSFVQNNLDNQQLPTGEFDLILSRWSLGRAPDPFAVIVRAVRQLRREGGGFLLFLSPPPDGRTGWLPFLVRSFAQISGRHLRPAAIYAGLPSLANRESFADGLISLVVLAARPSVQPSAVPPEIAARLRDNLL